MWRSRGRAVLVGVLLLASFLVLRFDARAQPAAYDPELPLNAPTERGALAVLRSPWDASTIDLRRAIHFATEHRLCPAESGLASVVDDANRDTVTRALAALALGEIRCHVSGARATRTPGLSGEGRASLETATMTGTPAALRQSATRALGRASSTPSEAVLTTLRADDDPVVRYLAAQALTRVTGVDHFDTAFRDAVVADFIEGAATYTITDDPDFAGAP